MIAAVLFSGCSAPKASQDEANINYAKENPALIKEMAEYAILFCRENNITSFKTDQVSNRTAKRKLSNLGYHVSVYYNMHDINYDSTVIFKTISFTGVKEYIYDFAGRPRNLGGENSAGDKEMVKQVNERIYFRRRPFPLM